MELVVLLLPKVWWVEGSLPRKDEKLPHFMGRCMKYRYEISSLEGLVQRIATNVLTHGFYYFVSGRVPEGKDPRAVDKKLLAKYRIDISRTERARRKQAGLGAMHYVRFGQEFFLFATEGSHTFRKLEGTRVRDIRRGSIRVGNYSISVRRGQFLRKTSTEEPARIDGKLRVRVQICREEFVRLRSYFREIAVHRRRESIEEEFSRLPFEPYAPVRRQFLKLLFTVNQARKRAGYEPCLASAFRYRRRIVRTCVEEERVFPEGREVAAA